MQYKGIFSEAKIENFMGKKFHILLKTLIVGAYGGGFNEYSQCMFWMKHNEK